MSLGHTFSSALHYTGPVTSPGTPIKAIQAKGCASPCCCCFVFFLGADEIFSTKHLSLISSLPFNTSWNECSSHLNLQITTPQVMHMKTHSLSLFTSLLLGLILLKNTQDSHWLTTLCWSPWEVHGLRDYHVLGWRQEGQDASWSPLWYTSKLWAADKFGSTPPQQLPSWFCVLLDKLKACGGDSLARHPTAVPFSLCPTRFPGYRPGRSRLGYGDGALTPGIKT